MYKNVMLNLFDKANQNFCHSEFISWMIIYILFGKTSQSHPETPVIETLYSVSPFI